MNVIGESIMSKASQCRLLRNKLRDEFAALLSVHTSTIEIIKPLRSSKGLALEIYIYFGKDI